MRYEIETVTNGYILKEIEKDTEVFVLIYETIDDVLKRIAVQEDPGSRYDDKRLYIIRAPGDKNEAFTEAHSKVIWGDHDKEEEANCGLNNKILEQGEIIDMLKEALTDILNVGSKESIQRANMTLFEVENILKSLK